MEEENKTRGDGCAQLIDLIPDGREWVSRDNGKGGANGYEVGDEKKLELKLGLPGEDEPSVLSLGLFPKISKNNTLFTPSSGAKRGFHDTVEPKGQGIFPLKANGFIDELQHKGNGKACRPPPSSASPVSRNGAACNNSSQSRSPGVPIVGWPPVRSFRRNLASSSKPSPESQKGDTKTTTKTDIVTKGLFVKINMDGVPIGRKVDLKAYDSYEKLSNAVDQLFRGLLAAQKDHISEGSQKHIAELPPITGLLNGTGEFTLVYEDDEGDRMLVGDVPWNMFVATAKRLRVLKTSELSTLSLEARKEQLHRVELLSETNTVELSVLSLRPARSS